MINISKVVTIGNQHINIYLTGIAEDFCNDGSKSGGVLVVIELPVIATGENATVSVKNYGIVNMYAIHVWRGGKTGNGGFAT